MVRNEKGKSHHKGNNIYRWCSMQYQHLPRAIDGEESQPNAVQSMKIVVCGCQNFIDHLGGASKRRRNSDVAILPERRWVGVVLLLFIGIRMIINLERGGIHQMRDSVGTLLPLHLEKLFHYGLHHTTLGRILGPWHGLGQSDSVRILVKHGRMVRIGQMDHVSNVGMGLKNSIQQRHLAGVKVFRYGRAEVTPVEVRPVSDGLQNAKGPLPLEFKQSEFLLGPSFERVLVLPDHALLPVIFRLHVARGTQGRPPGTQT